MGAGRPLAAGLRLLGFCREVEAGGLCDSALQCMSCALPLGHWRMMYLLEAPHSLRGSTAIFYSCDYFGEANLWDREYLVPHSLEITSAPIFLQLASPAASAVVPVLPTAALL